jgi:hypothetical protein
LGLAEEHGQTEGAFSSSGIPFVMLRNWLVYGELYDLRSRCGELGRAYPTHLLIAIEHNLMSCPTDGDFARSPGFFSFATKQQDPVDWKQLRDRWEYSRVAERSWRR